MARRGRVLRYSELKGPRRCMFSVFPYGQWLPMKWFFRAPLLFSIFAVGATFVAWGAESDAADPYKMPRKGAQVCAHPEGAVILGVIEGGGGPVAFGERGIILRFDRATGVWTQVPSPIDVTLTAGWISRSGDGWLVGHEGTLLHTVDGGLTWTLRQTDPKGEIFLNVWFGGDGRGFIVGTHGVVYRTEDGGRSWINTHLTNDEGFDPHLHAISAVGDRALLVVGEGGNIFRSVDGVSWAQVKFPYPGSIFGLSSFGAHGVVVYGMRGSVYFSGDLGESWAKLDSGTDKTLFTSLNDGMGGAILLGGAGGELVQCRFDALPVCSRWTGDGVSSTINGLAVLASGEFVAATARGLLQFEGN